MDILLDRYKDFKRIESQPRLQATVVTVLDARGRPRFEFKDLGDGSLQLRSIEDALFVGGTLLLSIEPENANCVTIRGRTA